MAECPDCNGSGELHYQHRCNTCNGTGDLSLTLTGYQEEAAKTAIYPTDKALEYLTLGLVGEAGEIANKVKKVLRGDYDPEALGEILTGEIGDVLWYVSELAKHLDLTLEEVAQSNLDKLASRKERGVIKGDGDRR